MPIAGTILSSRTEDDGFRILKGGQATKLQREAAAAANIVSATYGEMKNEINPRCVAKCPDRTDVVIVVVGNKRENK